MTMKITFRQFLRFGYIFGVAALIASLCFSRIAISVSQFIITGAWILERFDTRRMQRLFDSQSTGAVMLKTFPLALFLFFKGIVKGFGEFFRNRPALIFSSIILLHLAGLVFTVDFNYALKDLRTKLPFLLLPLFLSTSEPFGRKGFTRFMLLFFLAILVGTVINTWKIVNYQYVDIREVARHVSHIIFALLISLGIFSLAWFILKKGSVNIWIRVVMVLVVLWLPAYLLLSRSATGIIASLIVLMILLPILAIRMKNVWIKSGILLLIVSVSLGVFLYLRNIAGDYYRVNPVDISKLEKASPLGNPYIHNLENRQTENGNYLYVYIQWDELREAWNKRSAIRFDSLDLKNQPVTHTLVRFLASKGYRKDAGGVARLSPEEVQAIEKGVPNYLFMEEFSFRARIYEFLAGYETYMATGNPTGSSVMQRLEFWRASLGLIRANWLHGVGTGDMNLAFDEQYEKMNSKLAPDQRWRSHNQFMSVFIAFGVFGFAWFLFAIFYPPIALKRFDDYFFLVFLLIALTSMLTEDTIETQTGVTFFTFFYSFFLFARKEKDPLPQQ